jgi:hypothetical protein
LEACISNTSVDVDRLTRSLEKAKSENTTLRAANRRLMRNTGMSFESQIDSFKEFLQDQPTTKLFRAKFDSPVEHKPRVKSIFDKDHSETAVLLLSDLHTGEVVEPHEINGMNKFNPMILSNRLWEVVEKFIKIIRGHQSMYPIDKIWVPILGDLISGSIHTELALTNALLDLPSSVLAAHLLIMVIERVKILGLPIEVDTVVGNHGRLLAKMPTKKQAHLSLDWMAYVMLERHFQSDAQVTVRIHKGQFGLVAQRGHRYAIEHLAGYSYGKLDELAARIRNIFDNDIYRKATGLEGSAVDFVLGADKHRAHQGPNFIVNGCLPGATELTTSWRLSPVEAEQVTFGISNRNPVTWYYRLQVTENICEEDSNPFSKYTSLFMENHGRNA